MKKQPVRPFPPVLPAGRGIFSAYLIRGLVFLAVMCFLGCASRVHGPVKKKGLDMPVGTIVSGETSAPVPKRILLEKCAGARVVYLGETHREKAHHEGQLEIIRYLAEKNPDLRIGMEMFDQTYQKVLDQWPTGTLSQAEFLEKTHWYANWRFDYSLYQGILEFVKDKNLPLYGLNLPFHIPAKVAVGGLKSLLPPDTDFIPDKMDLTDKDHKAYVQSVFKRHPPLPGRNNFEYFYQAQCLWEDFMARSVADHMGGGSMVVLVGKGHVLQNFGIPNRAFARTRVPYVTVVFAVQGEDLNPAHADFVWITEKTSPTRPRMGMRKKISF